MRIITRAIAFYALLFFLFCTSTFAQNEPIIIEAEDFTLGADYAVLSGGSNQYISINTDLIDGAFPGDEARTASMDVTFPSGGTYNLYARVRVGPAGGSDDSFFYGNGFGAKAIDQGGDWIIVNNLTPAGYNDPGDFVLGAGTVGNNAWKWIQLSAFGGGEAPIQFEVSDGDLTQPFSIGAREDGFDIDKLAFAPAGIFYTVSNLDNGEPGADMLPNSPIIVQAESGTNGADVALLTDGNIDYATFTTDLIDGQFPGAAERVISYEVTFPAAGVYHLYARLRVNDQGFNDDSFFYPNDFGNQDVSNGNDWIIANGLNAAGYADNDDVVVAGGSLANNVWKWVKLTGFDGGEPSVEFTVPDGALTQTFQIGGREDGLDFDQLAFGPDSIYYTVENLNNGEPGTTQPPPEPYIPTGPPIAEGHPKFLGNVYSNAQIPFSEHYWNQITPENAGKWGSVEFVRDNMNWTQLDAAYNYAKENGFPFKFHVLIWGNQQPPWIEDLSPQEQREEIIEWFTLVAERYPDIYAIEVVNEPLHDPPNSPGNGGGNYIEALGGEGETGWDWIVNSFRLARKKFPNSKLMLNDYSIVNNSFDAQRYKEIIELLQSQRLIDQIGVQGHAFSTRGSTETMIENLDLLAETGLPIFVTELDIDGPTDQIQLEDYQRIFPVFWEHPAVEGITLWGWKPGHWRTAQGAYIAYENGAERPALVWLREYVESTKPPAVDSNFELEETAETSDTFKVYPNPSPYGKFNVEVLGLNKTDKYQLRVYDFNGKLLHTQDHSGEQTSSHLNLHSGTYILKIIDQNGIRMEKLVVR